MENNKKTLQNKSVEFRNDVEVEEEENFVENDVYLIELHKRLTAMKKERKKAEQDASLLVNRLRLLKNEEEKVELIYMN